MTQKQALLGLRILYPMWMVVGIFSLAYVPAEIISEDVVQTANNILNKELLFRLGIAGSLFAQLLFVFTVIALFHFFKSVNKVCVLNMVILSLVSVPIAMVSVLGQIAGLKLAGNDNELMLLFLNLSEQGLIIASIFWGLWLFPLGNLIRQSGYFPKIIGPAVMVGGVGYFLGAFVQLIVPNAEKIMPLFEILTLGEVVFIFWLIFKGAKLPEANMKKE